MFLHHIRNIRQKLEAEMLSAQTTVGAQWTNRAMDQGVRCDICSNFAKYVHPVLTYYIEISAIMHSYSI